MVCSIPRLAFAAKVGAMTNFALLAICAILVAFGILTIAVSHGFFTQLTGAVIMALGGSAGYLIASQRKPGGV
jgi:hypothetical protein